MIAKKDMPEKPEGYYFYCDSASWPFLINIRNGWQHNVRLDGPHLTENYFENIWFCPLHCIYNDDRIVTCKRHSVGRETKTGSETMSQYHVQTNQQEPSGKWAIYADDQGTKVGSYESPDDVRGHFHDLGLDVETDTVTVDGDGNGSIVSIPISWIGDGEKLIGSKRVLDLIGK